MIHKNITIEVETEKAYLVVKNTYKFLVPKKMCKIKSETKIDIYPNFKITKIPIKPEIDEIEGEVFVEDFIPKVKVVPKNDFDKVPAKILEEIINTNYREYLNSEFKGTYAEWCNKDLPF